MLTPEHLKIAQAIRATRDRINRTEPAGQVREYQLRGVRRTACHIAEALGPLDAQIEFLRAAGYGGDHEIRIQLKKPTCKECRQELGTTPSCPSCQMENKIDDMESL